MEAIRSRRSVKRFTAQSVAREELEWLLRAAVLAPNHRMTQPWRFYVLGPETRLAYGRIVADRKAARVEDAVASAAVRSKVEGEYAGLPALIAVTMWLDESPEVREEDFAATYMAVNNLCLAALALGLGTHLRSGAVLEDPRVREALRLPAGERLVSVVQLGHPAEQPAPKARRPAAELTRWLP